MSISSKATGLRPGVCTSTTRPSGPYTGQIIYETDTGQMLVWNGSSWGSLNPTANRNVIINGGMDVWQRGTTGFATTDGTYTADRWRHTSNNLTITRDTDVPTGFNYSAKLVGTSDNSFAQRIESINAAPLAGQIITVSFYAKRTSGSGALDVRLYYPSAVDNFASNTQIGSTYVVSSSPSSSWTRYTYTVSSVLPANVANGLMLLINNTGAATTFITGVQLEVGTQASAFERKSYGAELALCQRYYFRYQMITSGGYHRIPSVVNTYTASAAQGIVFNPVPLRSLNGASSIEYYGVSITDNATFDSGFGTVTINTSNSSAYSTFIGITSIAGTVTQGSGRSLELTNASSYLGINAEL